MKNFGDESFGQIDLRTATGRSVNTVYAELNIVADPEKASKAAEDAGVRSKLEANMANVLGTDYVTVMDMADGLRDDRRRGRAGRPVHRQGDPVPRRGRADDQGRDRKTQQVFDKDLMSDVIDAMTYPVEGGTARYVGENLGRPAAGKTGTSESFRSAWFNGYVPQLQAAVGLYRSGKDGEELQMEDLPEDGNITGGTFPARIWTAYMEKALEGTKVVQFPKPAGINKDADPPPPPRRPRRRRRRPRPPTTTSAPPTTTAPPTSRTPSKTKSNGKPTPGPPTPEPSRDAVADPPGTGLTGSRGWSAWGPRVSRCCPRA